MHFFTVGSQILDPKLPEVCIFYNRISDCGSKTAESMHFHSRISDFEFKTAKNMHFLQADLRFWIQNCQKYAFFTIGSQILDPKLPNICIFYSRISYFWIQRCPKYAFFTIGSQI